MNIDDQGAKKGPGSLGLMVLIICAFLVGIIIGAVALRPLEPRSLLAWRTCQHGECLRLNEITGLAAAVGIKVGTSALPLFVRETPYSIALRHPLPQARVHYIIIPKKDIKNIGELHTEDEVYLTDAFALMQELVKQEHLEKYIVKTNGPGYQDVAYLHFHLMAE